MAQNDRPTLQPVSLLEDVSLVLIDFHLHQVVRGCISGSSQDRGR